MKKIKELIKPFFIPFNHISTKEKISINIFWLIILIYCWHIGPVLLPEPLEILSKFKEYFFDQDFYSDLISSMKLTILAMIISIIIASLLAYSSTMAFMRPILHSIVKFRYMSLIGFLFIFQLIFKGTMEVKLVLLSFGIIPFFCLSLLSVITKIQDHEYDFWTTINYSKWEQVREILIIGEADQLIETIRSNFAMGWLMITMVETYCMSDGGLGVLLFNANKYNQLDRLFALQFVILLIGSTFDFLLKQLRYKVFPYIKLIEND